MWDCIHDTKMGKCKYSNSSAKVKPIITQQEDGKTVKVKLSRNEEDMVYF